LLYGYPWHEDFAFEDAEACAKCIASCKNARGTSKSLVSVFYVDLDTHKKSCAILLLINYCCVVFVKIERVFYPHLPSHPHYEIAKKQMKTGGGMITFLLRGGLRESRQFLENLRLFLLAESLGAVECLAEHPAIMTHASVPPKQRLELGILDNLIRLSVGIEDLEDILKDLRQALACVNANGNGNTKNQSKL
jgi:cystathionine beta-lyase/cystathionine gamma-synthase